MVTVRVVSPGCEWEDLERLLRAYEGRGFCCFPVKPDKVPWESWKAYADEDVDVRVGRFHDVLKDGRPFLIAGIPGSNIVVDVDSLEKFHAALDGAGMDCQCPEAMTPSGGRHLYFRNGGDVGFQACEWGEVRTGTGHYVVLPGSPHPADYVKDGKEIRAEYAWKPGSTALEEWEGDLPDLPDVVLELARREPENAHSDGMEDDTGRSILDGVSQGSRNRKLFSYACRCRNRTYDLSEALILVEKAASSCDPPYPSDGEESVEAMVRRVYGTYEAKKRVAEPVAAQTSTIHPLDLDAAIREIAELPEGLSTPWHSLNDDGVRFRAGELSIIAARLGHGKSAFLLNLICDWLHAEVGPLVLISMEMPLSDIVCKLITVETGWWAQGAGPSVHGLRDYFREGWETQGSWEIEHAVLEDAIGEVRRHGPSFWPVYAPLVDAEQIADICHEVQHQAGEVAAVLVDYVQLIQPPRGNYDRRDIAIGVICQTLKGLAVELGCPVITAAQINREGVADTNLPANAGLDDEKTREALLRRRPQVHQIREADTIGQYADMVLGLQNLQEDILGALPVEERRGRRMPFGPLEVTTLKSRFGTPTAAQLSFYGKTGAILERVERLDEEGARRMRQRREEVRDEEA